MKPVICTYCEGSETKIAVLSKEKSGLQIHRILSLSRVAEERMVESRSMAGGGFNDLGLNELSEDLDIEASEEMISGGEFDDSDISKISADLKEFNLNKALFIPAATEPSLNFHTYINKSNLEKNKLRGAIAKSIAENKNISISTDSLDYIQIGEKTLLSVFIEGGISGVEMINSLANYNGKRFYKIPSIKSAELSLAYYVSKTVKFFEEDYTLVIYTGKESSKLIFLKGQNIKHVGASLDIGTKNLHTYDVYFSKILLEMENGSIPRLDNVILCGEDNSENLMLSFYGTFPEANVSNLTFEGFDKSKLSPEDQNELSSFSIPLSVAVEYFDEMDKEYKGINILPVYIRENQKVIQIAWHSYLILPLLFGAAFFFTHSILTNNQKIHEFETKIIQLERQQKENSKIVDQIMNYEDKIGNFDKTQAILDAASAGTENWGNGLSKISDFMERRRNFWITKLETIDINEIKVTGYSLSRSALTEFADYSNSSRLNSVLYDPLRETNTYSFTLNYKLTK